MSMNKYNVYRSILSSDSTGQQTLQLIARIEAETEQIALDRAAFIKSFHTWDGKAGKVVNVNDEQPECEKAACIDLITANRYGNESLARQKKLIDNEIESHNRKMTVLREQLLDMMSTM